jgi:hypothetical protein
VILEAAGPQLADLRLFRDAAGSSTPPARDHRARDRPAARPAASPRAWSPGSTC